MAGNTGEVAFFEFRQNATEVAANIEQAMSRINRAVTSTSAGSTHQQAIDVEGLSGYFGNAKRLVEKMNTDMRGLIQAAGRGDLSRDAFKAEADHLVRGTMLNVHRALKDSFHQIPESTLSTLDFRDVVDKMNRAIWKNAGDTLRAYRPEANGELYGFRMQQPTALMGALGKLPFGDGQFGDPLNQLKYRKFLEDIVAADPGQKSGEMRQMIQRLGLAGDLAPLYKPATEGGLVRFDDQGVAKGIIPTSTAAELAQVEKTMRAGATANQQYQREMLKTEEATNKASKATFDFDQRMAAMQLRMRAKAGEFGDMLPGGRFLDQRGAVPRLMVPGMGGGLVYETDPGKISKAIADREKLATTTTQLMREEANYQRLMKEGRQIGGSSSYITPGGQVFRDAGDGRARELFGAEKQRAVRQYASEVTRAMQAEQRVIAQRESAALKDAQRNSGFTGGFMGRFHRGDMSTITALGQQVASATAFSMAYGSLFALQHALRDTLAEFLDYQDSVTDLEVATRNADMVTGDWVNTLSELSRLSGANVGAALDAAARGVRAFADPLNDTQARLEEVGNATAEAATKLAVVGDKSLRDATGDVVAVGSAFQLEASQLNEIVDAVANAKRNLGADPTQIAQGLALIAGSAQEAGFNLNEAASLIGLVQARTDQSGQAIATRLSRVFQIISGSTGKTLAAEMGVDPNQSIKKQLEAYAEIYSSPTTSEAARDRISSALGGTANLREILPILKESDRLLAAYEDGVKNAGAGTAEFERKMGNLVGTLKKMKGDISNIQTDLARTNIFAPFAIGVKALEPALHGLDLMIKAIDKLTGGNEALQTTLALMLDIALAAKAISIVQGKRALFSAAEAGAKGASILAEGASAAQVAARAGASKAEVQAILTAAGERAAAETRYNAVVVGSAERRAAAEIVGTGAAGAGARGGIFGFLGRSAGLRTLGRFATNPWTIGVGLGIGALAGIGKAHDNMAARDKLTYDSGTALLDAYKKIDGSSTSMRAAADSIAQVNGRVKEMDAVWSGDYQTETSKLLQTRRGETEYLRRLTEKEEERTAALQKQAIFGTGAIKTVGQLADGLASMAAEGKNVFQQGAAVRKALMTPAPSGVRVEPQRLSNMVRGSIFGSLGDALPKGDLYGYRDDFGAFWNPSSGQMPPAPPTGLADPINPMVKLSRDEITKMLLGQNSDLAMDRIIKDQAKQLGLLGKPVLSENDISELVDAVLGAMDFSQVPGQAQEIMDKVAEGAKAQLRDKNAQYGADPDLLNSRRLDPKDVQKILYGDKDAGGSNFGVMAHMEAELGAIPRSDDGTKRRAILQKYVALFQYLQGNLVGDNGNLDLALANAIHDFREAEVAQAEQLRKAAEARAKSNKELRAVRLKMAKVSVQKAGNDIPLLISIMEALDRQTIRALLEYQRTAIRLAQEARARALKLIQTAQALLTSGPFATGGAAGDTDLYHGGGIVQNDAAKEAEKQGKKIKGLKEQANAIEKALEGAVVTDDKAELPGGGGGSSTDPRDKAREHAALIAAKANAAAARRGGGMATARAQLIGARAALNVEAKGTTEWFNALASFYQAQQAMQDAVLQYRYTLDQLHGDITDPVENARDALRNARRTLAVHRRQGRGADVLAADRLAERQAEASLQQQRFQQRFNDAQTANELGRMSFQKYIAYLDHEHDRLTKIKHRTRQQQDQLDQVDRAMKDALSQFEGQFNLGNIHTNGMVYKARRYMAERQAARDAANVAANATVVQQQQDVRIQIDGADTAQVRRIIEQYVGSGGRTRTSQPRRRR